MGCSPCATWQHLCPQGSLTPAHLAPSLARGHGTILLPGQYFSELTGESNWSRFTSLPPVLGGCGTQPPVPGPAWRPVAAGGADPVARNFRVGSSSPCPAADPGPVQATGGRLSLNRWLDCPEAMKRREESRGSVPRGLDPEQPRSGDSQAKLSWAGRRKQPGARRAAQRGLPPRPIGRESPANSQAGNAPLAAPPASQRRTRSRRTEPSPRLAPNGPRGDLG